MTKVKSYLWNLLIALDQLVNAAAGGYPDETFSCRAYRKAKAGQGFWKFLCGFINGFFFWQKDHCRESYESEQLKKHSPAELSKSN